MLQVIIGIMALLIGTVTGLSLRSASGRPSKFTMPFLAGFVVCVLCLGSSCYVTVPTGHTGVVTTFGKVENYTLDAGMHFKMPWQSVINLDNRVQKARVELMSFSSDIQEVSIIYTVNYQISKENAMTIYSTIGTSYYDTVIQPNVSESVKVLTARYTAEDLVASRDELSELIESLLADKLNQYNILVVGTSIEDMDFTDAFTNAVEAKQVAAQNKLQAEIEQAQKIMEQEAAAKRAVIDANAAAQVAQIQAQADLEVSKIQADAAEYAGLKEAAKNKSIAESVTKDLLQYYYLQQWNGELPNYYVGSDNVSTIVGLGGQSSEAED